MSIVAELPIADRLRPGPGAVPLRLRAAAPHVHGYAWPHPSPAATAILIHGLQSHAGWFAEAAERLQAAGIAVYAPDRRGSGSSPAPRGDIARYGQWLADLDEVALRARADHPSAPLHLVGHCFGANLALAYALARPGSVASLVMLTPGLAIRPDYPAPTRLAILAAALLRPRARFPVPQRDELFSRDPAVLDWLAADDLGARTLTARCLLQIARLVGRLRRRVRRLTAPLLVVEAANDRIADNRRNRSLLLRAPAERCRFVTFEAEHFLLAEPCRHQVIDTLIDWMRQEAPQ